MYSKAPIIRTGTYNRNFRVGRKILQNQINVVVLIRHVVRIFFYLLQKKPVFVAGSSEINKRGDST